MPPSAAMPPSSTPMARRSLPATVMRAKRLFDERTEETSSAEEAADFEDMNGKVGGLPGLDRPRRAFLERPTRRSALHRARSASGASSAAWDGFATEIRQLER